MNKEDEKLFEEFVEHLIKVGELDYLLDRIPFVVKLDALNDYDCGVRE